MSIGQRALEKFLCHLGDKETGPNQGPPVEWACQRWLSRRRFELKYKEGKLQWCAASVCSAFDDAGSECIHEVASLSCGTFLDACQAQGYTVPLDQIEPGDIVWTDRDLDGSPNHVGIVKEVQRELAEVRAFTLLSGNSGPACDEVATREYPMGPKILAAARLPR